MTSALALFLFYSFILILIILGNYSNKKNKTDYHYFTKEESELYYKNFNYFNKIK
jgi:preprotein translocase subunit SecG